MRRYRDGLHERLEALPGQRVHVSIEPGVIKHARLATRQASLSPRCPRLDLSLPLRIVDVPKDLCAHALVQLRRAHRAAIELLSRPVRKYLSIAKDVEQQVALRQVGDSVLRVLRPKRRFARQQEVTANRGPAWGADKGLLACGDVPGWEPAL